MAREVTRWACDLCGELFVTEELADSCCQPSQDEMREKHCPGCEDDFYNKMSSEHCWSLDKARLIMRKKVHLDQIPPWNQSAKLFPNCYKQTGFIFVGPNRMY